MRTLIILATLVSGSAWAAQFPTCRLTRTPTMTLEDLRRCQDKALLQFVRSARLRGQTPTKAEFDAFDDFQRAEARALLSQSEEPTAAPTKPASKLGGIKPADLSRLEPKRAAAVAALQKSLQAAAGDGKDGITPAMAEEIRAALLADQGMLSSEMADLLDSVSRDGGTLTPATMRKLQNAARAAKGQNLDLGIDPKTEEELLQHDFSADQAAPGS